MQPLKSTSFTDPITNKSYTLGIYYDESPSDPFEDSDCELPLIYQTYKYSRRDTTHYGTNHIVSKLLDLITPRRLNLNRKELLEIIDVDEDYIKENKYKNQTFVDALIDELKGYPENLNLIEALARISKTPYSRHKSRGYSQGDYADVLIVLTPESFKKIGCKPKDATAILDGTKKLFDAYIWGDVYGFQLIEHKPLFHSDGTLSDTTDDETIDSCWGFYGDNLIENGMRDYLPDFAKPHLDTLI